MLRFVVSISGIFELQFGRAISSSSLQRHRRLSRLCCLEIVDLEDLTALKVPYSDTHFIVRLGVGLQLNDSNSESDPFFEARLKSHRSHLLASTDSASTTCLILTP